MSNFSYVHVHKAITKWSWESQNTCSSQATKLDIRCSHFIKKWRWCFWGWVFLTNTFFKSHLNPILKNHTKYNLVLKCTTLGKKLVWFTSVAPQFPCLCKTSLVVGTKDDSDVASGVRYDVASFLSWSMYYTSYVFTRVTSLLEFSYSRNNITSTDGDRRVNCHYTLRSRSSLLHDYFEDAEALCPNIYYCNT